MTPLRKKELRRARRLDRNISDRAARMDKRTAVERGYDEAVKHGVARAQAGSCIAQIARGFE